MPKSHKAYPLELKKRLVELVRAGRNPEELAEKFEPTAQSIRNWVAQADRDDGHRQDGLTTEESEELRRLTPAKLSARMRRATRLRPTWTPSAASSAWTRRSPYVPRARVWITRICSRSAASAVARADAGRPAHA